MHTGHISCNFVQIQVIGYTLVTRSSFDAIDSEYRLVSKVSFEVGKYECKLRECLLEFLEALFQIEFLDFMSRLFQP